MKGGIIGINSCLVRGFLFALALVMALSIQSTAGINAFVLEYIQIVSGRDLPGGSADNPEEEPDSYLVPVQYIPQRIVDFYRGSRNTSLYGNRCVAINDTNVNADRVIIPMRSGVLKMYSVDLSGDVFSSMDLDGAANGGTGVFDVDAHLDAANGIVGVAYARNIPYEEQIESKDEKWGTSDRPPSIDNIYFVAFRTTSAGSVEVSAPLQLSKGFFDKNFDSYLMNRRPAVSSNDSNTWVVTWDRTRVFTDTTRTESPIVATDGIWGQLLTTSMSGTTPVVKIPLGSRDDSRKLISTHVYNRRQSLPVSDGLFLTENKSIAYHRSRNTFLCLYLDVETFERNGFIITQDRNRIREVNTSLNLTSGDAKNNDGTLLLPIITSLERNAVLNDENSRFVHRIADNADIACDDDANATNCYAVIAQQSIPLNDENREIYTEDQGIVNLDYRGSIRYDRIKRRIMLVKIDELAVPQSPATLMQDDKDNFGPTIRYDKSAGKYIVAYTTHDKSPFTEEQDSDVPPIDETQQQYPIVLNDSDVWGAIIKKDGTTEGFFRVGKQSELLSEQEGFEDTGGGGFNPEVPRSIQTTVYETYPCVSYIHTQNNLLRIFFNWWLWLEKPGESTSANDPSNNPNSPDKWRLAIQNKSLESFDVASSSSGGNKLKPLCYASTVAGLNPRGTVTETFQRLREGYTAKTSLGRIFGSVYNNTAASASAAILEHRFLRRIDLGLLTLIASFTGTAASSAIIGLLIALLIFRGQRR